MPCIMYIYVYIYINKFNLPGGGDNKHSSAKYNKSESNLQH